MGAKKYVKICLNHILRRYGAEIVPTEILYEWQRVRVDKPCWDNCTLPGDAARYLKPDNPELIKLQQRYRAFDPDVTTPIRLDRSPCTPGGHCLFPWGQCVGLAGTGQ